MTDAPRLIWGRTHPLIGVRVLLFYSYCNPFICICLSTAVDTVLYSALDPRICAAFGFGTGVLEHNSVVNELHSRIAGTWEDSEGGGSAPTNAGPPRSRFTSAPGAQYEPPSPPPVAEAPIQPRVPRHKSSLYDVQIERPPPPIVLPKPIKVPLTDKSTPEDVRKWCLAMGLQPAYASYRVSRALRNHFVFEDRTCTCSVLYSLPLLEVSVHFAAD